jgi:ammonium transporter, Amt family
MPNMPWFLCLESGLTRNRNVIDVAMKNMTEFSAGIGFNVPSTLALNGRTPAIIGKTFLSTATGMLTALVIGWTGRESADRQSAVSRSLARLVAITASCRALTVRSAVIIGTTRGIVLRTMRRIRNCRQFDDLIGLVPVPKMGVQHG